MKSAPDREIRARDRIFAALERTATSSEPAEELHTLHDRLKKTTLGMEVGSTERFREMAEAAGAVVLHTDSAADVSAVLEPYIREAQRMILADHPLIEACGIGIGGSGSGTDREILSVRDSALQLDDEEWKQHYATADVGIDVAVLGIADAGAVLITSSEIESRSVSLLPDVHIALLPERAIVASLPAAADTMRSLISKRTEGADAPSALTLVGGPSKTADIEKVLITGVHGPRMFIVVLIADDTALESRP